ncbi:MAG: pseudouridine-5'-phosphate glycosidase [Anaerolineae bacterium]|nr:pseudouridine-5'-phosphate glycosidase [Anaerolineae bacterium]
MNEPLLNKKLALHRQVEAALARGEPVVALESTLITHGFPSANNVKVALSIEEAVREQGAVPATIAILKGQITVGLTLAQLEYLGTAKNVRKCSRRDLPLAVARQEDGATTVAGTMIVAHQAGIRVFATGGIGGVHRGQTFDESADLVELGRTPLAVVCAGAKAILDLPSTREVLETQGVPVIGYQTDEFPAFYSRQSGLPVDVRVDTPAEVADLIHARDVLDLKMGLLITVPIPLEHEWPAAEAQQIINQALAGAKSQGITGKTLTPYLLQRINELSGNRSQKANLALLLNNARVAAQIAQALACG